MSDPLHIKLYPQAKFQTPAVIIINNGCKQQFRYHTSRGLQSSTVANNSKQKIIIIATSQSYQTAPPWMILPNRIASLVIPTLSLKPTHIATTIP